jgi:hypothetical protein
MAASYDEESHIHMLRNGEHDHDLFTVWPR